MSALEELYESLTEDSENQITTMDKVKVKTKELLEIVKKNRHGHRANFEEAQKVYRQDVIDELDRRLKEAQGGKPIRRGMALPVPEDHTDDYDRVIKMLEMSVDPEIEIPARQFDMYVMDNWSWSAAVAVSNMSYVNKSKLA